MTKAAAMILGGGHSRRMDILCNERSKLVLPFGGRLRVIDFSLSNCLHSGIKNIAVMVDHQRQSLSHYLREWSHANIHGDDLQILEPKNGSYRGTADAVYQNLEYLDTCQPEAVLILAGDHVYRMDYRKMLAFHEKVKADVTIGVVTVPHDQASRFGIVTVNSHNKITDFVEKPTMPMSNLASMGIYIFNRQIVTQFLIEDHTQMSSSHDFGYTIIPEMMKRNMKVFAYKFYDSWQDIGTVEAYCKANMKLVGESPSFGFSDKWPVVTKDNSLGAPKTFNQSNIKNSIISPGCIIKGKVLNSVLSPGVVVEEQATVRNSVVMENTVIDKHSVIAHSILDEEVNVGKFCYIGFTSSQIPEEHDITVLGKGAIVPSYTAIGHNCRILPGVETVDFLKSTIPAGTVVSHG